MKMSRIACIACALTVVICTSSVHAGLVGGNVVVNGSGAFPDVAYDSVDGKYLVVWYGGGVFGRFVTNGGAVSGSAFSICDAAGNGLFPAIAYNAPITNSSSRGTINAHLRSLSGVKGCAGRMAPCWGQISRSPPSAATDRRSHGARPATAIW